MIMTDLDGDELVGEAEKIAQTLNKSLNDLPIAVRLLAGESISPVADVADLLVVMAGRIRLLEGHVDGLLSEFGFGNVSSRVDELESRIAFSDQRIESLEFVSGDVSDVGTRLDKIEDALHGLVRHVG